jgi:hypothetical protein
MQSRKAGFLTLNSMRHREETPAPCTRGSSGKVKTDPYRPPRE